MVAATTGQRSGSAQRAANDARFGGLSRRDFFDDVIERLRALVPDDLREFRHKVNMALLKIYYGNERVHYEVWINSQQGMTEIGLHFEDGPESTAAYLAFFDDHIVELKDVLGPAIELERWTTSWGHLFELVPLTPLNAAYVEQTARRLAAMVTVLQPLVDAAKVAGERSRQVGTGTKDRRRWRHS